MKEICPHDKCTGCNACYNACTHSAIKFEKDRLGFDYPVINNDLCVDCKLCQTVCPVLQPIVASEPLKVFVANSANHELQRSCSSGGIVSLVAQYIIENNGVVYGCTGEDSSHVQHIRIDRVSDIDRIKGSKYVKSDIGLIYKELKKDLLTGCLVLFVGTPCQVAGLKVFLRKSYNNLYTIDFVCHGVPSQQILNDALLALEVKPSNRYSVAFRRKSKKYSSTYGLIISDNQAVKDTKKTILALKFPEDLYITGFLQGLYYRNSCYQCQYACPNRVSEFTTGDFHDKDNKFKNRLNSADMLSKLLINNEKGVELYEKIKDRLECVEISLAECDAPTTNLSRPSRRHRNYDSFIRDYQNEGYKTAAHKNLKDDIRLIRRHIMLGQLVSLIKRVPFVNSILRYIRKR